MEAVRVELDKGARAYAAQGLEGYYWKPLHYAAAHSSDPAVVELLLDRGADIDAMSSWDSDNMPLHVAAEHNPNPAIIAALLDQGADVDALNLHNMTPLHYAAKHNGLPVIKLLLD